MRKLVMARRDTRFDVCPQVETPFFVYAEKDGWGGWLFFTLGDVRYRQPLIVIREATADEARGEQP